MLIEAEMLTPDRLYHTMTQTLIPRPIAWVLSDNGAEAAGRYNLAPFSYFTPVCSNPPVLMFSVGKKPDGSLKDTRKNIIERGTFVVHIPSAAMADEVTESARVLDFGVSEIEQQQLELVDFPGFGLPRLAHCAIAYGCELYQVQEMGALPQALIFGLVKQIYIDDSVLFTDAKARLTVDAKAVNPLARLGAEGYWVNGDVLYKPMPK